MEESKVSFKDFKMRISYEAGKYFYICKRQKGSPLLIAERKRGYVVHESIKCPEIFKKVGVYYNTKVRLWYMIDLHTGLAIKKSEDKDEIWQLNTEDLHKLCSTMLDIVQNTKSLTNYKKYVRLIKKANRSGEEMVTL